jgi:hypothetical protein
MYPESSLQVNIFFSLLHIFTRSPHLLLTLNLTPHLSADLSPLKEILIGTKTSN